MERALSSDALNDSLPSRGLKKASLEDLHTWFLHFEVHYQKNLLPRVQPYFLSLPPAETM